MEFESGTKKHRGNNEAFSSTCDRIITQRCVSSRRLVDHHGLTSWICRQLGMGARAGTFPRIRRAAVVYSVSTFPKKIGCQSVVFVIDDLCVLHKGKKCCHGHVLETPSDVEVVSTACAAREGWRLMLNKMHSYQRFERPFGHFGRLAWGRSSCSTIL